MAIDQTISEQLTKEFDAQDKSPFTEEGFDAYIKNITSYNVLLFRFSKYYSEKQGLKVISDVHIMKASESIYKSKDSKFLNFIISIAGILLGASISHLATLTLSDAVITSGSIAFMLITGLLGAFLLGYYMFK